MVVKIICLLILWVHKNSARDTWPDVLYPFKCSIVLLPKTKLKCSFLLIMLLLLNNVGWILINLKCWVVRSRIYLLYHTLTTELKCSVVITTKKHDTRHKRRYTHVERKMMPIREVMMNSRGAFYYYCFFFNTRVHTLSGRWTSTVTASRQRT